MHRFHWLVVLALIAGCATSHQVTPKGQGAGIPVGSRILLFEPDIKFYLMTAGGVPEPQPDWTQAARANFLAAARAELSRQGMQLKALDTGVPDADVTAYRKLHDAVGTTTMYSEFGGDKLPSKSGAFDLGLGPGVSVLKERYGADYGLFVIYQDYRASGGRMAFAFLAAAVGAYVPTGGQGGIASLVNLSTGEVVWFNYVAVGTGDLREPAGAAATVGLVFKDLPHG